MKVSRPSTGKQPTIVDLAAHAGVSLGTASRVLNNRRGVDPELRRRVFESIQALRFVRSSKARRAARENGPTITFVLSNRDFLHPVHARLLQGAEEFCGETGFFVVFKRFDYSPETPASELPLPGLLREHGLADSLILSGTNYPNLIRATDQAGIPYVVYGNNLVGALGPERIDQARSDDYPGAVEATRYLIQLGHRQICYIGDTSQQWYDVRYRGYLAAMSEAGLTPLAQTVALAPDTHANGFASAQAIFGRGIPITAIFAAADDVALGVWEHLRQRSIRVPEDISLLGFGDMPDSRLTAPQLTTVRVPYIEIGRELARLAMQKAARPDPLPEVVLPTELIKRGTTWPHMLHAVASPGFRLLERV